MSTHAEPGWIEVGRVKAAHPARREITLAPEPKYVDAIAWDLDWIYLRAAQGGRTLKHRALAWRGTADAPIVTLGPGTPRDMVAGLKGQTVLVPLAALDSGAVAADARELAGFAVVTEAGEALGRVARVYAGPHNAAVVVEAPDGACFSFPWVDAAVQEIDLDTRRIIVHDLTPYRVDHAD